MKRALVIGIGGVLILILGLLSGGLARLELAPGKAVPYRPLTFEEGEPGASVFLPEGWATAIFRIMQVVFLLLLASALLALVLFPRFRKRVLKLLPVALALLLLVLFIPPREPPQEEEELPTSPVSVTEMEGDATAEGQPPLLEPALEPPRRPPAWLPVLLALPLAAALAWWTVFRWWPRRAAPSPREEVRQAFQEAASALRSGAPVDDVVIRCWLRMVEILSAPDSPSLTPAELAARLRDLGITHQAVATLTRLFEEVRYGRKASEPRRQLALAALSALEQAYR